jgi:hypothetical protein
MADREGFPYSEDWRRDAPVLMRLGIMPTIAGLVSERRPVDSDRIAEALHCRTVRSEWDFSQGGKPFINIQYKYPSILFNENEMGHYDLEDLPLHLDDPETLAELEKLANTRTTEIWNAFPSNDFTPAISHV